MPIKNTIDVDEVHLWLTSTERCQELNLVETYSSWLDVWERSRYRRFRFPQHRHEYLVAHALLRSCLSRYEALRPREWAFSTNAYGRPEIQGERGILPLRFNLSHTANLVACAVTRSSDIGVDVEQMNRDGDLAAVVTASFAPRELAVLAQLTGMAWHDRFFDLWTLKEAYTKARGLGLALPLQQVAFGVDSYGLAQIEFDPDPGADTPDDWRFGLLSPTRQHRLAIAVRCPKPPRLQVGWAIPGLEFKPTQLPLTASRGLA